MLSGWTPSLGTLRRAVLYRTAIGFLLAMVTAHWEHYSSYGGLTLPDIAAALSIEVVIGLWVLF
ncbi:MAG TPA: hypothetical protein VKA48_02050, partial [Gammaproteobacteria bacterium]|nr:hypothetical protein [Gammaproteobacteria bacterium]